MKIYYKWDSKNFDISSKLCQKMIWNNLSLVLIN